jgi:membrane-associated phospholipid phosphatase
VTARESGDRERSDWDGRDWDGRDWDGSAGAVAQAPEARFGARALLAAAALVLIAVPFGLLLFLVKRNWPPLQQVDEGARDGLNGYAVEQDWFVTVMKTVSAAGSGVVYTVVFTGVVVWLLWRRLPRLAMFVAVTTLGSALLNSTVKTLVDRTRPVLPDPVAHAPGFSFPSGHAQSATVSYCVLLLVFLPALRGVWRRVAVAVAVVMVLAIGFSRVALGVHYVSDVLAGYALGAAWVAAMTASFNALRRERGRPEIRAAEGLEPEQADRIGVHDPTERDPE